MCVYYTHCIWATITLTAAESTTVPMGTEEERVEWLGSMVGCLGGGGGGGDKNVRPGFKIIMMSVSSETILGCPLPRSLVFGFVAGPVMAWPKYTICLSVVIPRLTVCVCVCVCVREREREGGGGGANACDNVKL